MTPRRAALDAPAGRPDLPLLGLVTGIGVSSVLWGAIVVMVWLVWHSL